MYNSCFVVLERERERERERKREREGEGGREGVVRNAEQIAILLFGQ